MSARNKQKSCRRLTPMVKSRIAAYVAAAGAVSTTLAGQGEAAIVANKVPQAFGINGEVNIDLNQDGQVDFQIDHDRVTLPSGGPTLDYLQVDKNDDNGAANPLAYPGFIVEGDKLYQNHFPLNGTLKNNDSQVLSFTNELGDVGGYVAGLKAGAVIGGDGIGSFVPGTKWDYQENSDFLGQTPDVSIRANRLIDEDATQIDRVLGGKPADQVFVPFGPAPEFPDVEDFIGLGGATRYVGVRVDLNDLAEPNLNRADLTNNPDFPKHFWYGWIGVRIDNEADATGTVTGWAYESTQGMSIVAGDTGPVITGDFDGDGKVGGGDFLLWQRQFGTTVPPMTGANGNNDNTVDLQDLNIWKGAFGTPSTAAATAASVGVPEPSTSVTAALGGLVLFGCWLAKRSRCFGGARYAKATRPLR